jgi:hypothetical protein
MLTYLCSLINVHGFYNYSVVSAENPPHQPRISKNRSLNGRVETANTRNLTRRPIPNGSGFEAEEENTSSADD